MAILAIHLPAPLELLKEETKVKMTLFGI